jgi:hypothetical protein
VLRLQVFQSGERQQADGVSHLSKSFSPGTRKNSGVNVVMASG